MTSSTATRSLGIAAAAATVSFGLLAMAVGRRETAAIDEKIHRRTKTAPDHPTRGVADAISPLGKWWTYVPAGMGLGAWLIHATRENGGQQREVVAGAAAIVLAGVAATALNPLFDRWLPQRPAPPGHPSRWKPVFPSGHAFGPAAVGLAAAYVLSREDVAPAGVAFPVALTIPLALSGSRVLLEKHWASDVLGGYLAAVAVAGTALVAYERARKDSVRPPSRRSAVRPRRDRGARVA